MLAIGFTEHLPISNPKSLQEFEMPDPVPDKHDLVVAVKAVSVNPVDVKVRAQGDSLKHPKIIGWDAAGTVKAIGSAVTLFKPGDEVYYAGDINRSGSNSQFQLIDERIVGSKPNNLNFEEAAAMPLTTLVGWEALFDRLYISLDPKDNKDKSILIINGAGGSGSIAIQLAKHVAGLRVVTTASKSNEKWVRIQGADEVIDYKLDIVKESAKLGHKEYDYILCLYDVDPYFKQMVKLIAPFGMIAAITSLKNDVSLNDLKSKSAGFVWALMFTRPTLGDNRMLRQHDILEQAKALFENGTLHTTFHKSGGLMNPENLRSAHKEIESGHIVGKITLHY
jgi:NADPH2:quinone reductase